MSSVNDTFQKSLAGKLVIWFAGAAMAMVLLTAGVLYIALVRGMEWRDDQNLMTHALSIRTLVQDAKIDVDYIEHEVNEDTKLPRPFYMRVIGPSSIGLHETPLIPEGLMPDRFPVLYGSKEVYKYAIVIDAEDRHFRVMTMRTPVPATAGGGMVTIQVALDTTADALVLARYAELILLVVATGLCLSVAVGLWIVRTQLAPLKRLADEVTKIEHSTLNRRVSLENLPTELVEFGSQFNQMVGRLEHAYASLRRYADDVAHELRTPINRIQLEAELALRDARSDEDYREALGSTLEECQHLTSMVKSLLFIARAENGRAEVEYATLNVAERLEKIRSFFENSAAESGVELTLECAPNLALTADDTLFQRAVSNLVANSIAHTPQGGSVALRAVPNDGGVVVDISDTGEGIAAEHQPYVFDRFFRGDAARRTDKDRVGLGLAITKTIVDLHRGRIALSSAPGSGTRFSLYFPAA